MYLIIFSCHENAVHASFSGAIAHHERSGRNGGRDRGPVGTKSGTKNSNEVANGDHEVLGIGGISVCGGGGDLCTPFFFSFLYDYSRTTQRELSFFLAVGGLIYAFGDWVRL